VIHDPDIRDKLDALPKQSFDGDTFRATRLSLDALASSYNGGRWMRRDAAPILYISLAREGRSQRLLFTRDMRLPQ
jgi:hypothetical protein